MFPSYYDKDSSNFFGRVVDKELYTQISLTQWDAQIPMLNTNVQRSVLYYFKEANEIFLKAIVTQMTTTIIFMQEHF